MEVVQRFLSLQDKRGSPEMLMATKDISVTSLFKEGHLSQFVIHEKVEKDKSVIKTLFPYISLSSSATHLLLLKAKFGCGKLQEVEKIVY